MSAPAGGAALDAAITAYPELSPDRLLAKLEGAVGYHRRAVREAAMGVERLRDKRAKFQACVDEMGSQIEQAEAEILAMQEELAQAEAALEQYQEVNG